MKLSFEEMVIMAKCLEPNLKLLLTEEQMPEADAEERQLSDENYDKLHLYINVLSEIYKFRPLPF